MRVSKRVRGISRSVCYGTDCCLGKKEARQEELFNGFPSIKLANFCEQVEAGLDSSQ